jgi:hypothetical protein
MAGTMKSLLLAAPLLALAAAGGTALAQMSGGMMDRGVGGSGMARMMGSEMMGRAMEGCMQMMQSMQENRSQRPNEQWRPPPAR